MDEATEAALMRAGHQIAALQSDNARLKAENFALAAGQCVNATANDGGRPYCAEVAKLRAELAEAKAARSTVRPAMSDTQTLCGYPSCDCERDPPPDPAYCAKRLPTREEQMRAALRFYASRSHYSLDDAEEFDTVSGEPVNWLFSGRDESTTMIEDGSIARAVLEEIYGPSALVYTAAALASEREAGRREMRHEAAMEAWMLAQKFAADPDDDGVVHWLNEAEAAIRALPVKGTMAQTGDE